MSVLPDTMFDMAKEFTKGLTSYLLEYSRLPAPRLDEIEGDWWVQYLGKKPLQMLGGPTVYWLGLPGWQGKRFRSDANALNIRDTDLGRVYDHAMLPSFGRSGVDRKPALILQYPQDEVFPLRYVVDELRRWDRDTLLGVSYISGKWDMGRFFPMPYALVR